MSVYNGFMIVDVLNSNNIYENDMLEAVTSAGIFNLFLRRSHVHFVGDVVRPVQIGINFSMINKES